MENQHNSKLPNDNSSSDFVLENEELLDHKMKNLKMTQVKAKTCPELQDEWTVIYSDSNSSVLSGADDDDDDDDDEEEVMEKDVSLKDTQ